MSQDNLVVNPTIDTGTDLSVKLNAWREAIHSCHMGNSRPAYAQAGITWIDEVSQSEWKWYVFDGANDLLIGTIDPTSHTLTLAIGSGSAGSFTDLAYTGTLTGGAGVIDIGNGQFFKDAAGKIGVGTKTPSNSFDLSAKTDAMTMPKGTTAQRPAAAKAGDIRFNSETGKFEGFTTAWGDIGGSSLDPASITPAMVSDKTNTSKGAFALPVGTSAERPTTPFNGMIRLNSALGIEAYISDKWTTIKATEPEDTSASYILVAGGGGSAWGGGANSSQGVSGGGAGGLLAVTDFTRVVTPGTYPIVIGAGGTLNSNGANSSAFGLTAIGGGWPGYSGGSGGGAGGTGTSGQGSAGASGQGGGGGAGAAGINNKGGDGRSFDIQTGATKWYAGGGGPGSRNNDGDQMGAGGQGGGGGGGNLAWGGTGSPGAANTGGGAGGSGGDNNSGLSPNAAGGSGVFIFVYKAAAPKFVGGTVTSYVNGPITFQVHTFTSSGNLMSI
jgi:hypothetical protein